MLTGPPPPSPGTSAPNTQTTQLLANPNANSVQGIQQYARMGQAMPGGLNVPGGQAQWPVAGMGTGATGLSANPLQHQNLQAIIAALQGQQQR